MRRLQRLFWVDPRVEGNHPKRFLCASICYGIGNPFQWRYIPRWLVSLRKKSPVDDRAPWISYGANSFLKEILKEDDTVFEYGSGGSTLFFADRVHRVITVEHDEIWYEKLQEIVPKNVEYKLVKKKYDSDGKYDSVSDAGTSYKKYVTSIQAFEDGKFNLVSVDGRARVQCVLHAVDKVKDGGYVLLDNSDRPDYYQAHMFMRQQGFRAHHFFGLTYGATNLTQTTLWHVKKQR